MNRFHLKLLACASMLADHVCRALFSGNAAAGFIRLSAGRIAFPLFAFMVVRGFLYTRSRLKYALSMLAAALASEVIYDRLFYRKLFYWNNQNVIFLLLLALIMLCVMQEIEDRLKSRYDVFSAESGLSPEENDQVPAQSILQRPETVFILQAVTAAVFGAAAYFLKLDYSFWGIFAVAVFYFFRGAPFYVSGALACLLLAAGYGTYGAFLAVIPLFFYKEARGRLSTAGKYAFYLFYPAHLAVLLVIRAVI